MAISVTAALVDAPDGNWNPDPAAGHQGWDNSGGDKAWVPDVTYYRRVILEASGDAGEVIDIVNWELFDGNDVPFVADASAVTVQATGGDYTNATAPALFNDRTTRTIWARNATAEDGGAPYYEDTGNSWATSILRANGPRVIVEVPVYYKWDTTNTETTTIEVEAYLPGSGGVPTATANVALANPDRQYGGDNGETY